VRRCSPGSASTPRACSSATGWLMSATGWPPTPRMAAPRS
jgi:hypothetical protein